MSSREEILHRLQQQARPVTPPLPWRSRRTFPDLAAQFATALTAAKGEVYQAATLEMAWGCLGQLLQEVGAQQVVVNQEGALTEGDLPGRWPHIDWHIVDQSAGALGPFCTTADVGLSSAEAALAETGTIIVSSGPGQSRLTTLLPPIHIALVPTSLLTPDIFTWIAARRGNYPANTILISGPSKTADIEMTLVTGVHGPKRFIVILYPTTGSE